MGYTKAIAYGRCVEIYEYERDVIPVPKRTKGKRRKLDEDEKYEKRKDNALQAQRAFKRLVAANLAGMPPLFASFTYAENMTDIRIGYKDFKSFIQALRYRFGKNFRYIAVPEFQKRGAVHFHVLFWDLPRDVLLKERKTRMLAKLWAKGYVDIIETDGHGKLSSYLAKYMAKAFLDRRLKNQKSYACARSILRPVVESNTVVLSIFYRYLNEGDTPVVDKRYDTKRLGECRYRLYETSGDTIPV